PRSGLRARAMRRDDCWCEDPRDGRYNRLVRPPAHTGHDRMWRDDHLYDIVGVLDWNLRPRISGRGSAIFLHLCRPGFAPTAGCIALRGEDLKRLLAVAGPRPEFLVAAKPRKILGKAELLPRLARPAAHR
ncbi:MAG TPA: L,D-transpeptidase family protein, partial [Propylenella sp.]|nr:L,D-transpeptidase family protein [Propylenella sp.]